MPTRVLVAYVSSTGCDINCGIDIAAEIADVPDLEVDVQPMKGVPSLKPYTAVYVGWVHPSNAGERELTRFLNSNAELLSSRAIWIVHLHPGCAHDSGRGSVKMTRLVAQPSSKEPHGLSVPVPAARRAKAAAPRKQSVGTR